MRKTIREMTQQMMRLGEEEWGRYAFLHEPLERKIADGQKKEYIRRAAECGREEARMLKEQYPGRTVQKMASETGVRVETPDMPNGGGHVIFAQFEESGRITIFMDCVKRAEELIRTEQLEDLFDGVDLYSVLLSHELFHAVEHKKRKQIFTQTEKIELWRKPFSNKSRILALSEMAAMAFAKELQNLAFSPYVLDVVLMYCYNQEAAEALFEEIMEAVPQKEEKDADDKCKNRNEI